MKKLTGYANDLAERIRQVPGATDVEVVGISPEPEIVVRLNQLKASQLGLDNTEVGKVVQYAFQGKSTSHSYTIGNDDYDIILQMGKDDRRTLSTCRTFASPRRTAPSSAWVILPMSRSPRADPYRPRRTPETDCRLCECCRHFFR